MNFVLDASVTMTWLLGDATPAGRRYAQEVLSSFRDSQTHAEVPVTWALEVTNVLARGESKQWLTEAQSESFLEMLAAMPIIADHATFSAALGDTLQLARRYRLSSYDASYLELALRSGLPLATLDAALNKAARKAGVLRFA
jgi:predicted nucleic acid-binding protein